MTIPTAAGHYRADIDGLRALAVLAILAFHLDTLPGGFLGVDVFFVISGFLITAIIRREVAEPRGFSLLGFYRRRVARVLPALLAMLAATCAIGALILLPGELRSLASSAAAAAGFVANVFFWRQEAYFGGMAEGRPLLHTWSLGVEEQFYLLYPLLLPLVLRWRARAAFWLVLAGSAASLAICLAFAETNPAPVFYLLPARAWQIGAGGLAALAVTERTTRPILAWIGLALIAAAFVVAVPETREQQLWAVAACAGAVLILRHGRGVPLLAAAPLRAVGLVSYSIYLWHWPIISLYRITHGYALGWGEAAVLAAVSLGAGALSYRWIEQPFRRRYRDAPRAGRVVLVGVAASLVAVAAALLLGRSAAHLRTLPPEIARIPAFSDRGGGPGAPFAAPPPCGLRGQRPCPASSPATVLLAGDSHANHLREALRLRFPDERFALAIATGCRPLLGATGPARCTRAFRDALRRYVKTRDVQAVILAAQWHADDLPALAATIAALRAEGMRVTVVGPVVEYDGDFPRMLARAMLNGDLSSLPPMRRASRAALDRAMAKAVPATGARYFSPYDRECPAGRCRLVSSAGDPMHFDYGHYTRSAARDIVAALPAP